MPVLSREAVGARVISLKARAAARLAPRSRSDFDAGFLAAAARCDPFTMTSEERLYGVRLAATYIAENSIAGDVVECGVWRGGSSMMAAITLDELGDSERHFWLYDTYTGMSEPDENDPPEAHKEFRESIRDGYNAWCYAPLDDVRSNMLAAGLGEDRFDLIAGKVEDTIPATTPKKIALLRLDTDWYESTRHELEHLWPKLQTGGVLIIDDYGHWSGARNAVDEYFDKLGTKPLLTRLDYSGRMCVKP